jgi:hypothetical protein
MARNSVLSSESPDSNLGDDNVRRGDNLMKIASTTLSNKPRKPGGALED